MAHRDSCPFRRISGRPADWSVTAQVAFADRILLNKTDLVDEAELAPIEARIKKINPSAEIFRCQQSNVDPTNLIGIKAFSLDKTLEMDPEFLDTEGEHEHDPTVSSTSTKFEGHRAPSGNLASRCPLVLILSSSHRTKSTQVFEYQQARQMDHGDHPDHGREFVPWTSRAGAEAGRGAAAAVGSRPEAALSRCHVLHIIAAASLRPSPPR